MKLGKHQRSKQNAKIYFGRSTTEHNLFARALWLIHYARVKELLCFVPGQAQ